VLQIAPPDAPSDEYPEGEVTIGEVNCELLTVKSNSDENLGKYRSVDGVLYPHIIAPLTTPSHLGSSVSTIRTNESPVLSRFFFFSLKLTPKSIQSLATPANPLLNSFLRFFTPQIPETTHSVPKDSPIRAFGWHNYHQVFAIGLQNDTVYIYDLSIENWVPIALKHEFQHHISAIEWSPQSGTVLAVACRYGICLWKLFHRSSPSDDKVNAYMTYLHYPGILAM
jgi:WD40 repeat protein